MTNLIRTLIHFLCSRGKPCSRVTDLEFRNQELQSQLTYINREMQIDKAKAASRAGRMPK